MFERLARALRTYAEKDGRGYPDWALRYKPIVRQLRRHPACGGTIVELGANRSGLAAFIDKPVVVVDISRNHLNEARHSGCVLPVQADMAALPFKPGAIDVCVSVDALEHVPEASRPNVAAEMERVSADAGVAMVAFPSGKAARQAERVVRDRYRAYTGGDIKWLAEHADLKLPDADSVARAFANAGSRRVSVRKNGNILVWRWVWLVLMCGWPGHGNTLFQALLRAITPLLCQLNFGTCYRSVIWIESGDTRPDVDETNPR